MYGWNESPVKAKLMHFIGGENPRAVFEIGEYHVEIATTIEGSMASLGDVQYAEPVVTYRSKHRHETNPRETLPNMEVSDGQIRIELTDLVGLVLSRLEPVDLARALWTNDEVKAEFMDLLVTRYNESGIGDAERRKFLHGVTAAVHSKALDSLSGHMAKLEYETNRIANFYDEIHRINEALRAQKVMVQRDVWDDAAKAYERKPVLLQFDEREHARDANGNHTRGELSVGGRGWEEAREFWRKEVLKQFPPPMAPVEPAKDRDDEMVF
jgi:hypothetical protein